MNKTKNENGLTLIELLAVIALTSVLSIFIFGIITKAMENTNAIQLENQLRDEADFIMSSFIKELYSTNQTHIVRNVTDANGSYLEVTTDLEKCTKNDDGNWNLTTACINTLKPIGFKKNGGIYEVYIRDKVYVPTNNVQILTTSSVIGDPKNTSIYEFNLDLKVEKKRGINTQIKQLNFNNKIQSITLN